MIVVFKSFDDAGMVDRFELGVLALKTRGAWRTFFGRDELNRDYLLRAVVDGFIHFTHPTFRDEIGERVAGNDISRVVKGRGVGGHDEVILANLYERLEEYPVWK